MNYVGKVYQISDWGWMQWYKRFASRDEIFGALHRQLFFCNEDNPEYVKFLFELFVQRVEKDKRYNIGIVCLLRQAVDGHIESLRVMVQCVSKTGTMKCKIPLLKIKEDTIYGFEGSTILGYAVNKRDVKAVRALYGDCFSRISTLKDNITMIKDLKDGALRLYGKKEDCHQSAMSQENERNKIEKEFREITNIICGDGQLAS